MILQHKLNDHDHDDSSNENGSGCNGCSFRVKIVLLLLIFIKVCEIVQLKISGNKNRTNVTGSPRTDNETQRVSDTASPDELNETLDSESQKSAIVTSAPVAEGCEFPPEMSGLWRSTLWGNVQISNNTIRLNRVLDGRSGLTSLTCFLTSDAGDYILRYVEKQFN